jgi:hypothetical protein
MNGLSESMDHFKKQLFNQKSTAYSPIEPVSGQIWKDQNNIFRVWTGKQWLPIDMEEKK